MRRVIVTGSRRWVDRPTVWGVLSQELQTFGGLILVHGGCPDGVDDIADRWAWGMNAVGYDLEIEVHRPDWERHGKRAGTVRNQKMAALGADVCHAFPLEGGTGTRHMMSRCFAAGIPVENHGFQPYTAQAREFVVAYG